jgi:hypothetical protein
MKCFLCQKEEKLIRRSHIIPDFFYRNSHLYNTNHTISSFTINSNLKEVRKSRPIPTGVYQKNILCRTCDNELIGGYETYLKALFYGGPLSQTEIPTYRNLYNDKGEEFTECLNISYRKAKLGLISILWRAAIANRDFFEDIVIESHDLELLREMIVKNDPKEIGDYPVVTFTYVNDNKVPKDLIVKPREFSHKKGSGFVFLIGGFFFLFYIKHTFSNEELLKYTLTKEGKMIIIWIKKGEGWDWILQYAGVEI